MKTIGLLGGMSWQSTTHYYRLLNEGIHNRLGGLHSARIVMLSVDFQTIERLMADGDWPRAGELLAADAQRIEAAGADFLLLGTNTMHKVADEIQAAISIPLLHIADAAGAELAARGVTTVGLLGTRFTMLEEFYRKRLAAARDIEVLIPPKSDVDIVDAVIFGELCKGIIRDSSRREYLRIIEELHRRGAAGVLLGCTEIGMLVGEGDTGVALYDTTAIHAGAAVELALA